MGKLATTLQHQLTIWKQTATETQLHPRFPHWVETAFTHLGDFCNSVGEKVPNDADLLTDRTPAALAKHICQDPELIDISENQPKTLTPQGADINCRRCLMFKQTLVCACEQWWVEFNQTLLVPRKEKIKAYQGESQQLKQTWENLGTQAAQSTIAEIQLRQATLKKEIKELKTEVELFTKTGQKIRQQIEDVSTWESWLGTSN